MASAQMGLAVLALMALLVPTYAVLESHSGLLLRPSTAILPRSRRSLAGSRRQASLNPSCVAELQSRLQASCQLPDGTSQSDAFKTQVARASAMCINAGSSPATASTQSIQLIIPSTLYVGLLSQAADFRALTGIDVRLTAVELNEIAPLAWFELQHNLTEAHDGLLISIANSVELLVTGRIALLTALAINDSQYGGNLQWDDVPPYFQSAVGGLNNLFAVPVGNPITVLFYRTDVLKDTGPPRTWSELLWLAQKHNGTDLNGDGEPDWGICLERDSECTRKSIVFNVLATYMQYNGTSQGVLIDPATMEPLFDNPATVAGLAILQQLLAYSPDENNVDLTGTCPALGSGLFMKGRCAMTLDTGSLLKVVDLEMQAVRGMLGTTALPGSEVVWDRRSRQVVACTAHRCPYGVNGTTELITLMQDPNKVPVYINRVAYAPANQLGGMVSAAVSAPQQALAYQFFTFLGSKNVSQAMAFTNTTLLMAYRSCLLQPEAVPQYVAAGYMEDSTLAYLAAVGATLTTPNLAKLPRIPHLDVISAMYTQASLNLSLWVAPSAISLDMQGMMDTQVIHPSDASDNYTDYLTEMYWLGIGYIPPNATEPDLPPFPIGPIPAIALAVPIVSTLLVVVLATVYEFKKHNKHKNMFGKVVAPGPYPDTTLLITDIQDSTTLWETLPSYVMDIAIKEHHMCIRDLLLKHSGYESATEGDSFILAFHCSEDALIFAMESQVALLDCDWPSELLECEACQPFYAAPALPTVALPMPGGLPSNMSFLKEEHPHKRTSSQTADPSHYSPRDTALDDTASASRTHTLDAAPSGSTQGSLPPPHPSPRQRYSSGPFGSASQQIAGLLGGAAVGLLGGTTASASDTSDLKSAASSDTDMLLFSPAATNLMNMPGQTQVAATFLGACQATWAVSTSSLPPSMLLFRGLRVRMGLHSGIHNVQDVAYNKAAARMQYSGDILGIAKGVSDTAVGGMILLDESAYQRLPMERLWDKAMVMHVGEYFLKNDASTPYDLYQVIGRRLMGRLGYLGGPMRHGGEVVPGVLSAPLGHLAVAFMNVMGASTLLSWNSTVARLGLNIVRHQALLAMKRHGGYLVEVSDEQLMVTFHQAGDAVCWALETHHELLQYDWPPQLLDHELCEELIVGDSIMVRGPRIKTGIDIGHVVGEVNAMTGRICYRGKVVSRAQRIVAAAASNQVLCSVDGWASARQISGAKLQAKRVEAQRLGVFKLRGTVDKVELMLCRSAGLPRPRVQSSSQVGTSWRGPSAMDLINVGRESSASHHSNLTEDPISRPFSQSRYSPAGPGAAVPLVGTVSTSRAATPASPSLRQLMMQNLPEDLGGGAPKVPSWRRTGSANSELGGPLSGGNGGIGSGPASGNGGGGSGGGPPCAGNGPWVRTKSSKSMRSSSSGQLIDLSLFGGGLSPSGRSYGASSPLPPSGGMPSPLRPRPTLRVTDGGGVGGSLASLPSLTPMPAAGGMRHSDNGDFLPIMLPPGRDQWS